MTRSNRARGRTNVLFCLAIAALVSLALLAGVSPAAAHAVTVGDKGYIQEISGVRLIPFAYLGAKHMVTGYDHILFLFGVIFFLWGLRQVAVYVSLFAIGHSTTMLAGVYFDFGISSYVIDAIIGFSVVYKALDNLGAFRAWFGVQPDTKVATLLFGFMHGFGLASRLIEYEVAPAGKWLNLIAFNVGVEIGQILALVAILMVMTVWRRSPAFARQAHFANALLMTAGFVLMGYQITGYIVA